jgi:dCTP deaminase
LSRHVHSLFPELEEAPVTEHPTGILPSQKLRELIEGGHIRSDLPIEPGQVQPSSLDLRLGKYAHRVRASFLPGSNSTVTSKLEAYTEEIISLETPQQLFKGSVYVVPVQEELSLPDHISGRANPKSTTGRLDIFTRLITNYGHEFESVKAGYRGKLFVEIVPGTFHIVVRMNDRLNQLRLSRGIPGASDASLTELDQAERLVYSDNELPVDALIDRGLVFSVDLGGNQNSGVIGYRAKKGAPVIDLARVGHYDPSHFWVPIPQSPRRDLVLNPEEFYILASREKVRIPPQYAAEMVPYDPSVGEFRIHYAGFFDPGFGYGIDDIKGTRAVLEVRSHEVPFLLEDGQRVGRLTFERLMGVPDILYGRGIGSSYQSQGLALSKHFKQPK